MRIYINGELDNNIKKDDVFLLSSIHLSNDKCDDNTILSENCMILDGIECECSHENNTFSCRWKGVDYYEHNNEQKVTVKDVIDRIVNDDLKVTNLSGYVDGNVTVSIKSIIIEDNYFRTTLHPMLFLEPIEFVSLED